MNSTGRQDAISAIRGTLFHGFADRYLPGPGPDGRVDAATAAKHAQAVAGRYAPSRRSQSNFLALLGLGGQLQIVQRAGGGIVLPAMQELNGQAKIWHEIAPYVWREEHGEERLAAKVENGKVVRVGFDGLPYLVFEPLPWSRSSGWLVPALALALVALSLTALKWPVAAIVHRRCGQPALRVGVDVRTARWTRILSAVTVMTMIGWWLTIKAMTSDFDNLSSRFDARLLTLQGLSLLACVGGLSAGLWNAVMVWRSPGCWWALFGSIVQVLSWAVVAWIAIAFRLIGFNVNY